jgi:regulator of protease activity HflC (stomatin/prohibitin superfamily)
MTKNRSFPGLVFVVIAGLGVFATLAMYKVSFSPQRFWIMGCAIVLAFIVSSAIQVADQWSKAVVLRLGKFHALQGPGLFFIVPLIDTIPYWIDIRVLTSSFKAEKTLTKDTVPVDVDAVLFWKIIDPKKAALDVADYQSAISWASQTALRDVIGKTMLSDMLEGRDKISGVLQKLLTNAPNPGVST